MRLVKIGLLVRVIEVRVLEATIRSLDFNCSLASCDKHGVVLQVFLYFLNGLSFLMYFF